jgi:hypothetical protein
MGVFAFGILSRGFHVDEVRIVGHVEGSRHIGGQLPVYLDDGHVLLPVPLVHVVVEAIEVILDVVAPGTLFEVEVNKYVFGL